MRLFCVVPWNTVYNDLKVCIYNNKIANNKLKKPLYIFRCRDCFMDPIHFLYRLWRPPKSVPFILIHQTLIGAGLLTGWTHLMWLGSFCPRGPILEARSMCCSCLTLQWGGMECVALMVVVALVTPDASICRDLLIDPHLVPAPYWFRQSCVCRVPVGCNILMYN